MDPKRLADIVSLLGLATFVPWLLRPAAAPVAGRSPGPSGLRRIAGARARSSTFGTISVAWLTSLGIEMAPVGPTGRIISVAGIRFILASSLLVGRSIDRMRGDAGE